MKGNIKQGQELEALITQITSIPMTVAIKEEDLDYLHQAKAILKRRIHSFPKDDEPRVDSVIRELEDFGNIDYSQYDRIVIQIVTSSAYPLMMNELNRLVSLIDGKFSQAGVLCCGVSALIISWETRSSCSWFVAAKSKVFLTQAAPLNKYKNDIAQKEDYLKAQK